jgi:glutamine amidotransferase
MSNKKWLPEVVIVDYGAGNIRSVYNALSRIGIEPVLSSDKNTIIRAKRVIIPGVGQAATAVDKLVENELFTVLQNLTQPVLGICLGMQLMCSFLHEGDVSGLSVFPIDVFPFDSGKQLVPHMGWNSIRISSRILPEISYAYFVHSFFVPVCPLTVGETEYGNCFSSIIQKDNFLGVQFHPEKSGIEGENFLRWFVHES